MQDTNIAKRIDVRQLKLAVRRRLVPAITVFFLFFALVIAVAVFMKPVYRSSATVLIEQQEIPQDLVRSTVTSFADQRIQLIVQRAMTFSRLSEIIKKYDLYRESREKYPLELVIEEMREDIAHDTISAEVVDPRSGRPVEATIAFNIAYVSDSPKLAQEVANELVSIFLEENLKNRAQMAEQAESFLEEELRKLGSKMKELESEIAGFKEENLKSLPEQYSLNISMLDRAEKESEDINRQIQSVQERKIYLENQLQQMEPYRSTVGGGPDAIMTTQSRIRYLQQQYLSLSSAYAPNHPDVMKVKRELDELMDQGEIPFDREMLEQQVRLLAAERDRLKARYGADHPEVKVVERKMYGFQLKLDFLSLSSNSQHKDADNPVYLQTMASIETARLDLANLESSKARIHQRIKVLEDSIQRSPLVEKAYRNLNRDLETTALKYQEVKAKLSEAQMAKALEDERKAERFTLIEPPLVPERPVKPNRLLIVLLGLIFAAGLAVGCIWLLEAVDDSVRSAQDIRRITGAAPLVMVPRIVTVEDMQADRRRWKVAAGSAVALIVSAMILVHFAYKPLDVLWYVALRKFS